MIKAKTPGEILKEARIKKGLTQDEVTKKAVLVKIHILKSNEAKISLIHRQSRNY